MLKKRYWIILAFVSFVITPQLLWSGETAWRSVGLRGGVNDHRNDEDFQQYEAFSSWKLPWLWKWNSGWKVGTHLEVNAGVLSGGGTSAFVGSIGPCLYITGFREVVEISLGINPTIISKHEFGDENLGGPFQFTDHIGLNIYLADHYSIGYRLQHMSNLVFYDHNPGVNMHMIAMGYRF